MPGLVDDVEVKTGSPPGTVAALGAQVQPGGKVKISWDAPSSTIPVISYYVLRFSTREGGARAWESTRILSGRLLSHIDEPLHAGSYVYMVGALNEEGSGRGVEVQVRVEKREPAIAPQRAGQSRG